MAHLALPNGNLVAFLARQCSNIGNLILVSDPKRPAQTNLFKRSYPMCPNLACQMTLSLSLLVLKFPIT